MAFTSDDLTAVERAMATGTLEVTVDGRTVKYRSLPELRLLRDEIRRDLGSRPGTVFKFPTYMKGL
ncbi:MAG: hypothetical protein RIB84_23855 [Sneathiellaceae bacterium]